MNEDLVRQDIIQALDDIRQPAENLVRSSIAAVRADRNRPVVPRLAGVIGVVITAAVIAAMIGTASFKHSAPPSVAERSATLTCALPVGTDQGPGLLMFPSGGFRRAEAPAGTSTAYNSTTRNWLATEPQGVAADGNLIALLDNTKGGGQRLRLETAGGKLLYSRDGVMRILGWRSTGILLVTTVDAPARLLQISQDGREDWIDPLSNATILWRFVAGKYVWGVRLPYSDPQLRIIVRLDLMSKAVTDWYSMQTSAFNDSGAGPILGLTLDGYPIVPQANTDSRSAVYGIWSKDAATAFYVSGGDEVTPSVFWPLDAISGTAGIWVTTSDGQLYHSSGTSTLDPVKLPTGLHVLSFAGNCK
jgi:hypothetical protein